MTDAAPARVPRKAASECEATVAAPGVWGLIIAAVVWGTLAAGFLGTPGCASPEADFAGEPRAVQPPSPADRRVLAIYTKGRLEAELPDDMRTPALLAAAREALEMRGYTITRDARTSELGRVSAKPPSDARGLTWPRYVEVMSAVTKRGYRIDIRFVPGDEVLSRALLDDILRRLGQ